MANTVTQTVLSNAEQFSLPTVKSNTFTVDHVLRGVGVATKAPADAVQNASQWASHRLAKLTGCEEVEAIRALQEQTTTSHSELDEDVEALLKIALAISALRQKSRLGVDVSAPDLHEIWTLVHGVLTRLTTSSKLHFTASRSAQGFIAVPLCSLLVDGRIDELFRLHVWLPDGERGMPEVAVHSHQPFAQSWILAGEGADHTFDVIAANDPSVATHSEYVLQWKDDRQASKVYKTHQVSSTVTNSGKLFRVTPKAIETHSRNTTYSVPAGGFHSTVVDPEKLHATLFFFDSHRGFIKDAGVMGPLDGQEFTQIRDPGPHTPRSLAELVEAASAQERLDVERLN